MDQQSSRVPPPRDDRPSRFEGRRSVFDERNSHSDRRDRDGSRERRYSRSRSRSPEYDGKSSPAPDSVARVVSSREPC